jgi:hypothetical protein
METPEKKKAISQYFSQVQPAKVAKPALLKKFEHMTAAEIEELMITVLNRPSVVDEFRNVGKHPEPLDIADGDPE